MPGHREGFDVDQSQQKGERLDGRPAVGCKNGHGCGEDGDQGGEDRVKERHLFGGCITSQD